MTSAEHPLVDDDQVGPYRLRARIASGGMATVFLAVKHGPSGFAKQVALKRIKPELAEEPGFIDMFLDEARVAAAIEHANVCAVLDFGEAGGVHFLAMEYLMGEPLRKLLIAFKGRQAIPLRRRQLMAARILADACAGLHAAHELRDEHDAPLNVVHRDISPQNIMVTYDGVVKVMDFGVATSRLREDSASTHTGTVKGKYAYMPPEQLRGETVDRRADVWALGVVLFETLTLRRLFARKNTSETILEVLNAPIPRVSDILPEVEPSLAEVVDRALRRDPRERYETAAEMGQELRKYLASAGELIDTAELSAQMHALFPDDVSKKRRLSAQATATADTSASTGPVSQASSIRRKAVPGVARTKPTLFVSVVAVLGAAPLLWALFSGTPDSVTPTLLRKPLSMAAPPPHANEEPADPGLATPGSLPQGEPETADLETTGTSENVSGSAEVPTTDRVRGDPPRPTRRVRRPAAVGPPGTVNVATPGGWADVYHRGRHLGQTPGSFRLPPGRQRLQLRPFGGQQRRSVTVTVESGRTTRVQRPL